MCWLDIPYIIFYHLAVNIGIGKSQEKRKSKKAIFMVDTLIQQKRVSRIDTRLHKASREKTYRQFSEWLKFRKYASRTMKTFIVIFKYLDIV